MEGLIIFLVISVISAVIGRLGSKEEEKSTKKQMPSMGQGPTQKKTSTSKALGDYAKKVSQELDRQSTENQQKKQVKREKRVTTPRNVATDLTESSRPFKNVAERPKVVAATNPTVTKRKVTSSQSVLPRTQRELAQSIIVSEILAPPVSKRK